MLEENKRNIEYFEEVLTSLETKEKERLLKWYEFCKKAHEWQLRKSWEPYFIHPLAVAIILWDKYHEVDLAICWLLHDTYEDNEEVTISEINNKFWNKIWFIIDAVSKNSLKYDSSFDFIDKEKDFNDERDKILYWWKYDIRCILVKLADRQHNLETLKFMPDHKQVKKSFESQTLYSPLMDVIWFKIEWITIKKARFNFESFVVKNDIKNCKELKRKLMSKTFDNFSDEMFWIALNNSEKVVWEINDKIFFKELLWDWFFDQDHINLISLRWDLHWAFKAIFKIYWWNSFKNLCWLKIAQTIF